MLILLAIPVVAAGIAFIIYLKRSESRFRNEKGEKPLPRAQDFLEFEDIQNGILVLPGGKYRLVLEVVGAVNFPLLSAAEQEQVEASFRSLVTSLTFPVQLFVQTRRLDISKQIAGVRDREGQIPEAMREYAASYAGHLGDWMAARTVLIRKNFIVIPYDGPGDFAEAERELRRRKDLLEGELKKWLGASALDTERLADVLYVAFNKSRATSARISDAPNYGFMVPVVTSGGGST